MVKISKTEITPLIADYYRRQLGESTYQLYALQQKYGCAFDEFAAKVEQAQEEDFERWDDYITWKGHLQSAASIHEKIKEIEDGAFEIA